MTIKEYFSQEQPIDNEVVHEFYYKNIQTIVFEDTKGCSAKIGVARIDENTWSFGWEIIDSESRRVLRRLCTTYITTKGPVDRLVYGMTKVLRRQLDNLTYPSDNIVKLIDNAIVEASTYCKSSGNDTGKITI